MLQNDLDFVCSERNKVYVCAAKTSGALAIYKALQTRVRQVAVEMAKVRPDVPPDLVTIEPDGRIGPTTAIGVQTVLAVLNRTVPLPLDLFPILSVQATSQETIQRIASNGDAVISYIDSTLAAYPDAMKMPVTLVPFKVSWFPWGWNDVTKGRLIGLGALVVAVGGGVYVGRKIHKKKTVSDMSDKWIEDEEEDEDEDEEEEAAEG